MRLNNKGIGKGRGGRGGQGRTGRDRDASRGGRGGQADGQINLTSTLLGLTLQFPHCPKS